METLPLGRVSFKNYKNLDDDQVELQRLNLFIGSNGSGKSNLVGSLRFFKESLTGLPSESRRLSRLEEAILGLGGRYILDARLAPPAKVNLSFTLQSPDKGKAYQYTIELLVQGAGKEVVAQDENLIEKIGLNPENIVAIFSSLSARERSTDYNIEDTDEKKSSVRRTVIDAVSGWLFYNANQMSLGTIRAAEPKIGPSDRFLSPYGENLPLVFDNLDQEYPDFGETITTAMREILPWTKKVRAVRSGRLGLVVEWSFHAPGSEMERFYLTEMSDGSVRMLSWAMVLLSPEPANLLVIEEPEIGVHVAWMPALAKWIKSAAQRTQVIVSTHSPDLLDQFTDEIPNVLVFQESSKRKNRFAIQRLEQDRLTDRIEQGWQLGDLYRVGDPEVGGWPW